VRVPPKAVISCSLEFLTFLIGQGAEFCTEMFFLNSFHCSDGKNVHHLENRNRIRYFCRNLVNMISF